MHMFAIQVTENKDHFHLDDEFEALDYLQQELDDAIDYVNIEEFDHWTYGLDDEDDDRYDFMKISKDKKTMTIDISKAAKLVESIEQQIKNTIESMRRNHEPEIDIKFAVDDLIDIGPAIIDDDHYGSCHFLHWLGSVVDSAEDTEVKVHVVRTFDFHV